MISKSDMVGRLGECGWYQSLFIVQGRTAEGWTSPFYPEFGIYAGQTAGRRLGFIVVHLPSMTAIPLGALAGLLDDALPSLCLAIAFVDRIHPLADWSAIGNAGLPVLLGHAVKMIAVDFAAQCQSDTQPRTKEHAA